MSKFDWVPLLLHEFIGPNWAVAYRVKIIGFHKVIPNLGRCGPIDQRPVQS